MSKNWLLREGHILPDFLFNKSVRVIMEFEANLCCQVYDVSEKNLGQDVTRLDLNSGELRLIEVMGIGGAT